MKKLLVLAALAAIPFSAQAADLPSTKAPPVMAPVMAPPPVFTWTGLYVGVQGGGEWADISGPFTNASGALPGPYKLHANGGLLGARVGYNWQTGNYVFGVEGDLNGGLDVHGSALNVANSSSTLYDVRGKQTWTGDIRGRLGYAIDRTLIYAAGGVAFGNVKTSYAFAGGAPFASETTSRVGWTLGAGVEYAFTNNIIGNVEYRYTDLGRKSFVDTASNTADRVKFTSNAVLVGVAYKF